MRFFKKMSGGSGWTALKTGSDVLSMAHVEVRKGAKPVVTDWCSVPFNLDDAAAVRNFVSSRKLNAKQCVALLNRSDYQLLLTDAVNVPPSEVKQAVRWAIKDLLHFPAMLSTIDVLDIPADKANPSRRRFVLAVAARNEVIKDRIVRFIDKGRANLKAIDVPEVAQRNIAALLEREGRGVALLSFNEDGGVLTITSGGELFHSMQLNVNVDQLQTLDEERIMSLYDRVSLDVQRTLDNFDRHFPYVTLSALLLAPFPRRGGLLDYLRSYISVQVTTFDLEDIFDLTATPELQDQPAMQSKALLLLGVALREES